MSVDLGDLERPEADGIIGVAKPGRREVDAKPAAKLQQRTCADGLSAFIAREERSAFPTSYVVTQIHALKNPNALGPTGHTKEHPRAQTQTGRKEHATSSHNPCAVRASVVLSQLVSRPAARQSPSRVCSRHSPAGAERNVDRAAVTARPPRTRESPLKPHERARRPTEDRVCPLRRRRARGAPRPHAHPPAQPPLSAPRPAAPADTYSLTSHGRGIILLANRCYPIASETHRFDFLRVQ